MMRIALGLLLACMPLMARGVIRARNHKRLMGRDSVPPVYDVPHDLTPGEVAMIARKVPEDDAILATLIDLIARRFVAVENAPGSGSGAAHRTLWFSPGSRDPSALMHSHETRLYDALFDDGRREHVRSQVLREVIKARRREIISGMGYSLRSRGVYLGASRRPSRHGRSILAALAGLHEFLARAFADYAETAVDSTEQFDRNLAFATALGIETPWSRFLRNSTHFEPGAH